MNRRGFIGSILALGVAPAIVRADALMRIVPRDVIVASGWTTFSIAFDGPTSRLVMPEVMVFSTAHDAETRRRVIAYMEGIIASIPEEAGEPVTTYRLTPPKPSP